MWRPLQLSSKLWDLGENTMLKPPILIPPTKSLQPSKFPCGYSPTAITGLSRLFEARATPNLAEDMDLAYPEPSELQFLNPEPSADVEAHLKASKATVALKADSALVKLADLQALLTRSLAEAMSHLTECPKTLDAKVLAERLSDIAKLTILNVKQNELARIEIACAAFKVPISAAKTERGVSLPGATFAKNVERLRKDKKTLVGEDNSRTPTVRTTGRQTEGRNAGTHGREPHHPTGRAHPDNFRTRARRLIRVTRRQPTPPPPQVLQVLLSVLSQRRFHSGRPSRRMNGF